MNQKNINEDHLKNLSSEVKKIEENIEQLKIKQGNIVSEIKTDIKKWYKKWAKFIIGGFSLLTIYALFQIYNNVVNKSEEFITKSITLKFAEPKITYTLNEVAENQAQKIIENNLDPAIQKATSSINQKIESFEKDLQEFKDKYDSELKKLAKEVEYLKNRNVVLKLSDQAIATGDAAPFEELENIYDTSTDNDIKMIALSEVFRVKSHFATMTRIKGITVKYSEPRTGKEFAENEIPTEALIQGLKEAEPWQYRARIAELIKSRKEKKVPEALLGAIKNDKKLEVRKKAIDSFESITGFTSRDVFKYNPVKEWWEQNKKNVEKDLRDLQTIEEAIKGNSKN